MVLCVGGASRISRYNKMSATSSRILAIMSNYTDYYSLQNKDVKSVQATHKHKVNLNLSHDKENNLKQPTSKSKFDETSIWSLPITLDEMRMIENGKFEYGNSYDYIQQNNFFEFNQAVSNTQLTQPKQVDPVQPSPSQSALAYPAPSQPAPIQLAPLQLTLVLPSPPQSAPTQPVLTHVAPSQPDLTQLVLVPQTPAQPVLVQQAPAQPDPVHLAPADPDPSQPASAYLAPTQSAPLHTIQDDTLNLEYLVCSEQLLPPSIGTFLGTSHFEDSDDSVKDKDYVPSPSSGCSQLNDRRSNADAGPSIPKRKKRKTATVQTAAKKLKKNIDKYYLKPPCHNLCKKLCTLNFSEDKRLSIHADYWSMDWETRGIFLKSIVHTDKCAKTTSKTPSKRRVTHKFYLINNEQKIEVCKTFFLCTLGYDKKNDRHVLSAIKKGVLDQKDKRDGRNLKIATVDKELLTEHVNLFNPCVHHYRRAHAPNKKYLPSDLTITMMHEDFMKVHTEVKCSFETYRNHVTNIMNISFAKLGHEECELCEKFHLHNADHVKEGRDPDCETCDVYTKHKEKYTKARKNYDVDAKRVPNEDVYVSADLQKVIMLPRLDSFKSAIFCPRIVVYNETFVPLGKYTTTNSVYAAVWHEAVSGRKQEDLVSTFRAFLLSRRDATSITIWLDNCSAQNKNWCLITFLINIINSVEIASTKIVLKYFEPGHTFMSADSFHHNVEQSLQKKNKVYDFQDFSQAVGSAKSGKIHVKQMELTDFFVFKSHVSQQKLKDGLGNRVYLKDIVEIMVNRGTHCLYYKTDFDADEYGQLFCLKSKKIPKPDKRSVPKGITSVRKQDIIKKLGPLMPENRLTFWKNIPVSAEAADATEYDFDDDAE